jgi:hypothetical protein
MGQESGPVWGGAPGTGGRPRRMGNDGGMVGNVSDETVQATIDSGAKAKENPLLQTLKDKMLPAKQGDQPVSGLLYFLWMETQAEGPRTGLSGPAGKLSVRFK